MSETKTVHVPIETHTQAKIYCATHGVKLTDLVSQAVSDYLKSKSNEAA